MYRKQINTQNVLNEKSNIFFFGYTKSKCLSDGVVCVYVCIFIRSYFLRFVQFPTKIKYYTTTIINRKKIK